MDKNDKITVGESALKVVVGEKKFVPYEYDENTKHSDIDKENLGANNNIDKTLSTPLPDVHSCVEMDVEKLVNILETVNNGSNDAITAQAIANSKSILNWKKVDNG